MTLLLVFVTVLLQFHEGTSQGGQTVAVYGFQDASTVVVTGRVLHYSVHLDKCDLTSGPENPELAETFGGHVTTWRMFNDREISAIPFMMLYDQKMVYNNTGRLVQLSRQMQIWSNDTVDVTSIVYTPDFGHVTYMYTHACTMSSASKPGNIDLRATMNEPERLYSFENITEALESGYNLHFSIMSFLCSGGKEHAFSSFGGHIPNYELTMEDENIRMVSTNVQQIAHFDAMMSSPVVDVINMNFYDNRTVQVIDARARPPYLDPVHEHVSTCILYTGMPGGTVSVYFG